MAKRHPARIPPGPLKTARVDDGDADGFAPGGIGPGAATGGGASELMRTSDWEFYHRARILRQRKIGGRIEQHVGALASEETRVAGCSDHRGVIRGESAAREERFDAPPRGFSFEAAP